MEIRRVVLFVVLGILTLMLCNQWKHDYGLRIGPQAAESTPATTAASETGDNYVPAAAPQAHTATAKLAPQVAQEKAHGRRVQVKTDVLSIAINLDNGSVVQADLLKYPISLQQQSQPVSILSTNPSKYYTLQSGITGDGLNKVSFAARQAQYELQPGQDKLEVTLVGKQNGAKVTRTYVFQRGHYAVVEKTVVKNAGSTTINSGFYQQITRVEPPKVGGMMMATYQGGAVSSTAVPYHKVKYDAMRESPVRQSSTQGWVAMQQHYFLSTWIPQKGTLQHYYSHVGGGTTPRYSLGYQSTPVSLSPGQQISNKATFYIGPELPKVLDQIAPGLALTVDYGWFSVISSLIFSTMTFLHHYIGNWGWTIIAITVLLKMVLYIPSASSYRSMAKMKAMAPRLKALQERHADDRQAFAKAQMALMKEEKASPLGGCLPQLIQMPIFIALYWVIIESVELRQSPFMFWLHDLSLADPFYILPVVMGACMFLQQKMAPTSPDPSQAKMMLILPVFMTYVFLHFPAGLVLYWITNTLVSMAQQVYVTRHFDVKAYDQEKRRKKKKKTEHIW